MLLTSLTHTPHTMHFIPSTPNLPRVLKMTGLDNPADTATPAAPNAEARENTIILCPEEAEEVRKGTLLFVLRGKHLYELEFFDVPQNKTTRLPGSGMQVVGAVREDGGRLIYLLAADRQREHLQP